MGFDLGPQGVQVLHQPLGAVLIDLGKNPVGRGDGTAMAVWELRNLGAGDVAAARARRSQYNQANLNVVEVQAAVAEEVLARIAGRPG